MNMKTCGRTPSIVLVTTDTQANETMSKNKKTINEPAREIPVLGAYDVVVCGGGAAGGAAAIAAARRGAKTILVERDSHLGGAAVSALVNIILSTNGADFQGIWHEWAATLQGFGGISPLHWESRMGTRWLAGSCAPEMVKLVWDRLLSDAEADILHFALAVGAVVENGVIRAVIVETKGGRAAILAKRVIDCTGDADVCAGAGAGFDVGLDVGKAWTQGVSFSLQRGVRPDELDPRQVVNDLENSRGTCKWTGRLGTGNLWGRESVGQS